jgi:hypothetical protein
MVDILGVFDQDAIEAAEAGESPAMVPIRSFAQHVVAPVRWLWCRERAPTRKNRAQ